MKEQQFTITLQGQDSLTDDVVGRLYDNCDDASAGRSDGVGHLRLDGCRFPTRKKLYWTITGTWDGC